MRLTLFCAQIVKITAGARNSRYTGSKKNIGLRHAGSRSDSKAPKPGIAAIFHTAIILPSASVPSARGRRPLGSRLSTPFRVHESRIAQAEFPVAHGFPALGL